MVWGGISENVWGLIVYVIYADFRNFNYLEDLEEAINAA